MWWGWVGRRVLTEGAQEDKERETGAGAHIEGRCTARFARILDRGFDNRHLASTSHRTGPTNRWTHANEMDSRPYEQNDVQMFNMNLFASNTSRLTEKASANY